VVHSKCKWLDIKQQKTVSVEGIVIILASVSKYQGKSS